MGYFNYFIKCIIRNISYKLCKPKILLSILLCIILVLFCFRNYGYCYTTVNPTDVPQTGEQVVIQHDNVFQTLQTLQTNLQDSFINHMRTIYAKNPTGVKWVAQEILNELVKSSGRGILVDRIDTGYRVYFYYFQNVINTENSISFEYDSNDSDGSMVFEYVSMSNMIATYRDLTNNDIFPDYSTTIDIQYPRAYFYVFSNEWIQFFKDVGVLTTSTDSAILGLLQQIVDNSSTTNAGIKDAIEDGNKLQQESNQIQQEQNDFLKEEASDDDVSIDSFNSVDSNDITSSGLTGVFTNIYNSITNWSSKDISLPIPYTNKSIKIPANYTENMLSSFGGSWIVTFIHSIYYFIVARFIIYSITGIINSIKSGSILETDSKNNITTDML